MIRINEMVLSEPASRFLHEVIESIAADPSRSFVVDERDAKEIRSALRAVEEEEAGAAVNVERILKSDDAMEDERLIALLMAEPCKENAVRVLERVEEIRGKLEAQSGKADTIERNQARAWIEIFRYAMDQGMDRFISSNGSGMVRIKEWIKSLVDDRHEWRSLARRSIRIEVAARRVCEQSPAEIDRTELREALAVPIDPAIDARYTAEERVARAIPIMKAARLDDETLALDVRAWLDSVGVKP